MALPSHHVLPFRSFHHIAVMVGFMSLLLTLTFYGFLSVHSITQSWVDDTENRISIELPSFIPETNDVLDKQQREDNKATLEQMLKNDPVITGQTWHAIDDINTIDERFSIPAPLFLTLDLHPLRAKGAEQRIINNITTRFPSAKIRTEDAWQADINRTAAMFQTIFAGLGLTILLITGIVLSGIVRTQLKASQDTITLIHLMGAESSVIARLFQNAVTRPVFWGSVIGIGISGLGLPLVAVIMGYPLSLYNFWILLPFVLLGLILMTRLVTYTTVALTLRGMP